MSSIKKKSNSPFPLLFYLHVPYFPEYTVTYSQSSVSRKIPI